jgi:hypothetical protein
MTKKEVAELKKLYKKEGDCITRISGCYVGNEQEKIATFQDAFYSLPEEDTFKYYDVFKKTLSGTLGKNLLELDFPLDTEMEGGTQEFLLRLRDSQLKDDELLAEFYDKVITCYYNPGSYLILLIHNMYDIPGVTSDGLGLDDASDEVYSFLLCSICPVKLSKPGLTFNSDKNVFESCVRDWLVDLPEIGFLFPIFNDRSADLHSTLYYTKNADVLQEEFVDQVLGAKVPMPLSSQKEMFQALIEETLGEKREYATVMNIQEAVSEKLEENKENPEPLALGRKDMAEIFEESGVEAEQMEQFENVYERVIPEEIPIMAANVINAKKFEVKTANITVQVKPEYTYLLETKIVDGRNCLVIAIEDQVEVNGISLS